jgi:hypothetical protein
MKHFALVGFLAALIVARLDAQKLFDVQVNPTAGSITFTAEIDVIANSLLLQNITSLSTADGITFLNFFPGTLEIALPGGLGGTPISGLTHSGSLPIYPLTYDYDNPTLPPVYNSGYSFDNIVVHTTAIGGRDTSLVGNPNNTNNPSNIGNNLNLFRADIQSARDIFDVAFSKPGDSAASLTIQFSASFPASQSVWDTGPRYIYAGNNNVYTEGDPTLSSFLGTYQLTVVPEPSTYAAIAGGLGLAAAVIHRRRQRAKAAQG